MPTYNRGYCIRRSVDSILNQTFRDFELIVVDDGSTDDTKNIMESYDDPRIVYIHNVGNRGQTPRLNQGLSVARADLIAFQDSDDEWMPEKLEKQVSAMQRLPLEVGVVYTDKWRCEPGRAPFHWRSPVNMPEDGIIFDKALEKLWIHNVTITTGLVDTNTTPMLLKNVVAGRLQPRKLITHEFALDDLVKAYDTFGNAAKERALKVIIRSKV